MRDQADLPVAAAAAASSAATAAPAPTGVSGIDVSQFTTITSWANVKSAGKSFTGIEAAQGGTITNADYAAQVTGALGAGLRVMPYVFANPGRSTSDPTFTGAKQFDTAWAVINGISGRPYTLGSQWMPVALDMEWDKVNFPAQECYGLTTAAMISWIQSFVTEAAAKTGAKPVIYTSTQWWTDCTGNSATFSADPLWIAAYGVSSPTIPSAWPGYAFWQSSNTGTVSGISGSVDLDQAKGITIAAQPSRSTTAGFPTSFQVSAADSNSGFPGYTAPKFTATGLPPGLSISSTGAISGWPSTSGSYSVKVTATDGLKATATVSFTWTVKAAPDSGTTGTVRQHGGSNLCLDDPLSKTANGTAIDLATCNGKSNQNWTAAQDGTVRVLGHCLEASSTKLILETCGTSSAGQWKAGAFGALVSVRYGTCLNGPSAAAKSGTKPTLATCQNTASKVSQHWTRPWAPVVSGVAARCLGIGSSGTALLLTCSNVSAQHWAPQPAGTFAIQSSGKCLAENGQTAGFTLQVNPCNNTAPSQQWRLVAAGSIATELKSATSGLCVTVPSMNSASGAKLVLGACSGALTATWRVA